MSSVVLRPWISQDHLKTVEEMLLYLDACVDEGDPVLIAHALGVIAKASDSLIHPRPTS
jgi:DNA-binding phage protein